MLKLQSKYSSMLGEHSISNSVKMIYAMTDYDGEQCGVLIYMPDTEHGSQSLEIMGSAADILYLAGKLTDAARIMTASKEG
jgi:hypothetical protein